jgi:hypothetical protein
MSGIAQTLEADFGAIPGQLRFEEDESVAVEFMIDAAINR